MADSFLRRAKQVYFSVTVGKIPVKVKNLPPRLLHAKAKILVNMTEKFIVSSYRHNRIVISLRYINTGSSDEG